MMRNTKMLCYNVCEVLQRILSCHNLWWQLVTVVWLIVASYHYGNSNHDSIAVTKFAL